jgi:hypothetical protein
MKRKLLFGALLLGTITANAQSTVFEENWDATGPGIAGWLLIDGDGKVPYEDPISELVTDAWNVLTLEQIQTALGDPAYEYPTAATGMAGNVAVTNSWYDPAGASNDWLISPAIQIPAGFGASLTWAANSLGNNTYLEDYEVLISTTTNSSVDNFTQILDVPNEVNTGNYRTLALDAYAGQTVYLAFRNKSNDQYAMMLDNIKVTSMAPAGINDYLSSKLSVYPNPASNVVTITNSDSVLISSVAIVDVNGRTIKNVNFDGVLSAQVSVSDLASGMYIMNITSDQGTATKKIVKN